MLANYIYKDPTTGHFTCNICYKANAQKNNIMKHIEGVHFPGQFVYTCSICSKNFNGKNSLQVHMYKFHNKSWKMCQIKTSICTLFHFILFLADPSVLEDYIKRDQETGLFICNICGKTNRQKTNIKNHLEGVHFHGQFVYECSYCGKRFNGKNSLSVHVHKFHPSQ